MLDLPGQPLLDKQSLVGACIRLPLQVDAAALAEEVANLPASMWGTTGGRVGVHTAAEALFLRGHAPAEGDIPILDRPALEHLPYVKWIIRSLIPASAQRCLLARLPAGGSIAPHIDRAPYFSQTIRIHVAVQSHEQAYMLCAGQCYVMRPGEVWALNNCARHGVWNAHASLSRTHLICDFLPSETLLDLLTRGARTLGTYMPAVEQHVAATGRR
ncbi:MAG TPA: aspartyl/asparaginyl beta-hydroxylase domain-containing protein [Steroidobacteraceae bacterium]|nr:aspartyl/asparaginyl beta-hydroxylase domain-containing protein [Steroidobacteraceae bacterium]